MLPIINQMCTGSLLKCCVQVTETNFYCVYWSRRFFMKSQKFQRLLCLDKNILKHIFRLSTTCSLWGHVSVSVSKKPTYICSSEQRKPTAELEHIHGLSANGLITAFLSVKDVKHVGGAQFPVPSQTVTSKMSISFRNMRQKDSCED